MLPRACLRATRAFASVRSYATPATHATKDAKPRQGPDGTGPPAATSTAAAQPFSAPLTPGPVKPDAAAALLRSKAEVGTILRNINYFKNKQDPVAREDSDYPEWLWHTLDTDTKGAGAGAEGDDAGDLYSKSKKARRLAKKRQAKLAEQEALNPEVRVPVTEQTIDLPYATTTRLPGLSEEDQPPIFKSPLRKMVATMGGVGDVVVPSQTPAGRAGAMPMRPSVVEIGGDSEIEVDAVMAARARRELRHEMRKKNRAAIKERNFLSQM